jgi:N-acetylglucosamine-6-sulfatase
MRSIGRLGARSVATASLCLGLVGALGCCADEAVTGPIPDRAASTSPPNFILILADDQDVSSMAHMPVTRRLIGEDGLTFTNAFVTTSLCCPSRVSILRGQYAHNHGVLTNNIALGGGWPRVRELGLESSTIATALHDAGYTTALFGKYVNGYSPSENYQVTPEGWDEWFVTAATRYVRGYAHNGAYYQPEPRTHDTDFLRSHVVDFVSAQSGPFFIAVWIHAPHYPAVPAARYAGAFASFPVPHAPSFDLTPEDSAASDALYRQRLESLQSVDDLVAALATALQANGQMDNTYVIYTSDNGMFAGEHGLFDTKNLPFEEAIRVPFMIRGPGIPRNATRDQFVLNIDIAPTIADLAGVQLGHEVDGRSMRPLFGGAASWRRAFLVENFNTYGAGGSVYGVRDKSTAYFRWLPGGRDLFDLTADPYQMHDLSSSQAKRGRRYQRWAEALRSCAGASCRELENAPPW